MSKTTLTLNREYFTAEITEAFLEDFEKACLTMELEDFTNLFVNYDLEFIEDYKGVFDLIAEIMTRWKNPGEETKLLEVTKRDSKCIFCNIGKNVKVYSWTYVHTASADTLKFIYRNEVGFYFEYLDKQLIEFGVCNGYN